MRAGRYRDGAAAGYFVVTAAGDFVDWRSFDLHAAGAELRQAVQRTIQTQDNAAFCAALSLLEGFLADRPGFGAGVSLPRPATLEPPIVPRSFICVGLNYSDHARESGAELPSQPLLFAKTGNALSGHGHPVRLPAASAQVDYEAELAVIMGRACRNVTPTDALSFVAGYTCANDVSARDFQFSDGQWYRGKSCDSFGPIGPWIVTPAEVGDPHDVGIRLRLNGKLLQDSNTSNLIFRIPELISFISRYVTLMPGDVISTGTPPGVGFARKPPLYLKPGDQMEVEIDRIGVLVNPVEAIEAD